MATIDFGRPYDTGFALRPLPWLRAAWQHFLRRRDQRRALALLARLDARLIADAGLDPASVRDTTAGWDRLDLAGFRPLLPRHAAAYVESRAT